MNPIKWGIYNLDAEKAQKRIQELWDLGHNTHTIAATTSIPEARVDRVVTDHITRKRFARKPP
jgi:hypothetical protein